VGLRSTAVLGHNGALARRFYVVVGGVTKITGSGVAAHRRTHLK